MTPSRWRATALLLAVALLGALGALAVVATRDDGGSSAAERALALSRAESGAEKAARAAAVHLTSYDFRTVDQDFSWAEEAGTAKFRRDYAEVSAPVKKAVTELEVHAEGTVDQAAATARDADHATVLLFVDQTLVSSTSADRQLATPRITMTMVRSGGRWLVDHVAVRNLAGS